MPLLLLTNFEQLPRTKEEENTQIATKNKRTLTNTHTKQTAKNPNVTKHKNSKNKRLNFFEL